MSIFYCEGCGTQKDADFVGIYEVQGETACDDCMENKPYCFECDHLETDPACIDTETCSKCGGLL